MASVPLVKPSQGSPVAARSAALGAAAVGWVLLIASLLDLGILWIGQRQATTQWEFVAVTSTAEAVPRLALALGLLYVALYLGRSRSRTAYRLLSLGLMGLGLGGAALGALVALQYIALAGQVNPEAVETFRTTVIKTGALSALYFFVLVPFGFQALRGAKDA